ALLGVIVFGVQLVDKRVRMLAGWSSMTAAIAVGLLTRSATVLAALVVVGFLVVAVSLIRRARNDHERANAYIVSGVSASVAVGVVILFHAPIFDVLDKSSTLSGRVQIWDAVIGLASERPWFGWGWISHWAPWVDPLGTLARIDGVYQLQAHNAWLDVWMQLGVLGLAVFSALVLVTAVRTWWLAIDRRRVRAASVEPFVALTVLPLLVLAALLVQSISESRLLVEGGLLLFTLIAAKTKRHELG
ncbi:MAG TPA: O-antigen ligase family protein, partial [Terrimesophilobacter sp.]|nr:O-antigen ligase family protein [Terrimesophilobacter sp.]